MNKKIIKILAIIFLIPILTNCALNTFDMYQGTINELLQDPKSRIMAKGGGDVNDLKGCPYLYEMGEWERYGQKFYNNAWNRDRFWFDGRIISSGGISLDFNNKQNSSYITKQSIFHPVYIGPWQSTILTKPYPFSFTISHLFTNKTKFDKELRKHNYRKDIKIRFFAYQPKEGGEIQYQYESMNEKNKDISEKSFNLSPSSTIAPDRFSLCVVKWTAKFGYDAIAEVKSKNSWSKDYLVPTGKVIKTQ